MKHSHGFGEKLSAIAQAGVAFVRNVAMMETGLAKGVYDVEIVRGGRIVEKDKAHNVVVVVGKNQFWNIAIVGNTYTAPKLGLMGAITTGAQSTDTMASHSGWVEAGSANAPTYSQSARPTPSWATPVNSGVQTSSAVSFSITSSGTLNGCFLTDSATKDGTTGTLYSAGAFASGSKTVSNGDTVNVTYSITM